VTGEGEERAGAAWRWYALAGLVLLALLVADLAGWTETLRP
jgi:hypothetical protein